MGIIREKLTLAITAAVAVVVAALGLAVAGSADASAAPAAAPSVDAGDRTSVTTNGLRLRSQPGYSGYVKGLLYSGDRVFVRETFHRSYNPDWVGVVLTQRSAGGLPKMTRGYVHKSYLR
ncbi:SH3 domain-containing protein [Streptomyces niveus]|uniref:SH3 domain-containing protein n=1 Tax=Streptomyces niveus TaxID=193462 RepID=UPI003711FA54